MLPQKKSKYAALLASVCIVAASFIDNSTAHSWHWKPKPSTPAPSFALKSSIDLGDEGAAEISAYDKKRARLFTLNNADDSKIDVVDISDIEAPEYITSIEVSQYGGGINSVAIYKNKLAAAIEGNDKQANGKVVIINLKTLQVIKVVEVGALPDMVTFTPNGKYILTANEGEPNDEYTVDPEGTVSIIDCRRNFKVTTLNFNRFNRWENFLVSRGLRVFGPEATLSQDLEPEFITVSDDSRFAWVSLQENNGLAKIDIKRKKIINIFPLGYKDHSLAGNELDASNKDDSINIKNWPVFGMYQPDAIAHFSKWGQSFIVTANEGDAREYDGYEEEARVKDLDLDPTIFQNAFELQEDENLGRIKTTTSQGDLDGDGDVDQIFTYGARSFSIWSGRSGRLIYDSGSEIANITAAERPEIFNQDEGEFDDRSDDKGAEPEGVAVGKVGNRQLAFIGLERTNGVLVFDISNPFAPTYLQWLYNEDDIAPEGLIFIPAQESPNGKALLVVSNEVSGTVSIYEAN